MSDFQILVADTVDKNNSVWIDATLNLEDIQSRVGMLEAEEFVITKFMGFKGLVHDTYGPLTYSTPLSEVREAALYLERYGEAAIEVLEHFGSVETATEAYQNAYYGAYESLEDYAYEMYQDSLEGVPEHVKRYIDYEAIARDMDLGGEVIVVETGYKEAHIFGTSW